MTGTVPAGTTGTLLNTVTVAPPVGTIDPVPGNNSANDTNPVGPQADLTITKSSAPQPYVPGAAFAYAIVVSNDGPSDVTNARVQDALPAAVAGFGWTCVATGTAVCHTANGVGDIDALVDLPAVPPGTGSVTFTVSGTLAAGTTGTLLNTVTVMPPLGTTDLVPGDNSASDSNPVGPQADLSISKTSAPAPYVPGTALTYTIVVSNGGPSDVSNARVQDVLPAALSGFTWTCAASAAGAVRHAERQRRHRRAGQSAGGHAGHLHGEGTVPSATTGNLVNTVTVTPPFGTTDPVLGNNSAQDTATAAPAADVTISKTVDNATPNVGSNVTFTLTVSNAGPSDASDVAVADPLPAGYSYVSSTPSVGSYSSGTGVWTIGTLANGGSATLTITATVLASGPYLNTATATSTTFDPTTPNTATATTTPVAVADVTISKTVDNATPNVGSNVIFTLTVSNAGPSDASDVAVADLLPAGYGYVSSTPSVGSYSSGTGVWTIGTLANGGSATLTITATVLASGPYLNTATATSTTFDPTTPNTATATTVPVAVADVTISKTVDNATPNVGSNVTFTLTVSNAGPSAASDVAVADRAAGRVQLCVVDAVGGQLQLGHGGVDDRHAGQWRQCDAEHHRDGAGERAVPEHGDGDVDHFRPDDAEHGDGDDRAGSGGRCDHQQDGGQRHAERRQQRDLHADGEQRRAERRERRGGGGPAAGRVQLRVVDAIGGQLQLGHGGVDDRHAGQRRQRDADHHRDGAGERAVPEHGDGDARPLSTRPRRTRRRRRPRRCRGPTSPSARRWTTPRRTSAAT